jgi:hypothetical protein
MIFSSIAEKDIHCINSKDIKMREVHQDHGMARLTKERKWKARHHP